MSKRAGASFDMQFITSSISTMLVLVLLGTVVFFVMAANNLSVYVRENIAFSILLSDDMKEADILRYQKALNQEAYVKQTSYISKQQALKEQTEAMGTDPAEFLGYNPFTASIEVKLNAGYANSDSVAWIKDEILAQKGVLEINYPQDLLDAKRFLIHTMKLVGASWSFIRRPFLMRNVWVGILAGAIADVALIGLAYVLVKYEPDLLAVITPEVMIVVMVSVFIFGVVITSLCALISINRYLRMKTNELYYN